ncbi:MULTISPECIES: pyrroline-5-carboxylate reductase dimerization domain-containing protein [Bacillaceae]|uniref:Pyrroline-5-carboxylate reductase n=1 Tax=Domibacillus aminovorans TaxID=29332 RepID=A0A177KSM8_9BACI|nr:MULTISPECIES: pyrroline-5-carboxylate reductase dimerization domain-containing protein [Bacillaceae]OAH56076.1 hypothetical protein AWH48_05230 [Domibacillus aminovorans]
MNIGIIGTGSIGTVLTESFITSHTIPPESLYVYNRSIEKAYRLQKSFPGIHVCQNVKQVAEQTQLLFISVRQPDLKPLLESIAPYVTADHCLISTASAVSTAQMESVLPCACARVIPAVTNTVSAGGILYSFGDSCGIDWQKKIIRLLNNLAGASFETNDEMIRAASDLTGCGPAFFSKMANMYAKEAMKYGLTDEEAEKMSVHMMIGLGELLKKKNWSLEMLTERTAAKGGVTGRGIVVIEEFAGDLFSSLCKMTQQKAAEDRKEASATFGIDTSIRQD